MKKHILIRGKSVPVLQTGDFSFQAEKVGISRGAITIELAPGGLKFIAKIAGEDWEGRGDDPQHALTELSKQVLPETIIDVMSRMQKEV